MQVSKNLAVASYLDWWIDAGVVEPVQNDPFQWLQPMTPANDLPSPAKASLPSVQFGAAVPFQSSRHAPQPDVDKAPAVVRKSDLPSDLPGLDNWLRDNPALPGASWSPQRILPRGPSDAPIMVIADVPDTDDFVAGHLLAGPAGVLFDAMLAAIKLDRKDLRIGSIALTRPAAGRWDDASAAGLLEIALRHIEIVRPKHVLLLGQLTCRLLTGEDVAADGEGLRNINHYGVTTAATAIHHPRVLLRQPALKRGAWTALKSLREPG